MMSSFSNCTTSVSRRIILILTFAFGFSVVVQDTHLGSSCGIIVTVHALATFSAKSKGGGAGFGTSKTSWKVHETDNSATTQRLISFLQSQKAEIDNIEIGYDPITKRRGLYATKKIAKADKIICRIPSDCALALSDPSQQGTDAPTIAHGGKNLLQMYMNNPQARAMWSPYLDTLPAQEQVLSGTSPDAAMTPDFFTDEEIALLEFPRLISRVKQRKEEIEQVAAADGLDKKELQYATWLVSTRAFPVAIADEESGVNDEESVLRDERGQVITSAKERNFLRVLIPFIDIANHRSDAPNVKLTIIDPEKDDAWFALKTLRPIQPGKELTLSYGSGIESSIELFLNYGFVDPNNPIDTLMLKKGGDDILTSLDQWTTTLQEDQSILNMLNEQTESSPADIVLKKILSLRIKLKQSYNMQE